MYRASVLLLLLLPTTAVADMVAPGFRRVPVDVVFELHEDPGSFVFFLVSQNEDRVERLSLAPGQPVRINGDRRQGSGRIASLYAVSTPLLASVRGGPDRKWFVDAESSGEDVRSASIDFYGSVPFFDPRDRIIRTYRVEVRANEVRLRLVGENPGTPWTAVAIVLVMGVVCFGIWIRRRRVKGISGPQAPGGGINNRGDSPQSPKEEI